MGDNVAGPSGTQPKANNSSSAAASRGRHSSSLLVLYLVLGSSRTVVCSLFDPPSFSPLENR
jgi:hypothetical protein